jgi:hypothetical protein
MFVRSYPASQYPVSSIGFGKLSHRVKLSKTGMASASSVMPLSGIQHPVSSIQHLVFT